MDNQDIKLYFYDMNNIYYTVGNHNQKHHENINEKLMYSLSNYKYSKTKFNYSDMNNYKEIGIVGVLFKMIYNKNKIKVRVFLIINAEKKKQTFLEDKNVVINIPVSDKKEEETLKQFLVNKGLIQNTEQNEPNHDDSDEPNQDVQMPPLDRAGKKRKTHKRKHNKKRRKTTKKR